ncbi:MAG: helix-turn-helix domain-containing protein [Chthoniobacterales bacterium]
MQRNARNIIGPQLRRIRNKRGLSQPKFAELLQRKGWDISRDIIAKIEDQRRWVADFEVAFLAEALKITIPDLFTYQGRPEKPSEYIVRLERRIG